MLASIQNKPLTKLTFKKIRRLLFFSLLIVFKHNFITLIWFCLFHGYSSLSQKNSGDYYYFLPKKIFRVMKKRERTLGCFGAKKLTKKCPFLLIRKSNQVIIFFVAKQSSFPHTTHTHTLSLSLFRYLSFLFYIFCLFLLLLLPFSFYWVILFPQSLFLLFSSLNYLSIHLPHTRTLSHTRRDRLWGVKKKSVHPNELVGSIISQHFLFPCSHRVKTNYQK